MAKTDKKADPRRFVWFLDQIIIIEPEGDPEEPTK